MAEENIKTTLQFQADITDFKGAMSEANRAIKLANSEFKSASSGMDDWANSTDGLSAKLQQLAKVQEAEERKLDVLKTAYAEVVKEQGENSKAAQELQIKINNQQAAVNKAAQEHKKFSAKLEDVENVADDVADALEDAGEAAEEAGKEAEESGDGWTIAKDIISDLASQAISSFIDAITSAAEETREYRREMSRMAENAKDAGHEMEDVKDILSEVSAATGETDAAMEGLNMLMASGFDTREIEKASKALSGAATKFSGLKFEAIAEGIQETLAVGQGVGPFAELIERTGGNLEEFNAGLAACTTEAEKQQYVLKWLADSGLADVHEAYMQNNADLVEAEKAQFRVNEAMAGLGAAIEPVNTHLDNVKASLLEGVTPALESVVGFVMDNLPAIEPIVAGIAGAMGVLAAKMAITGIISAVTKAWAVLNATMKANPAMLVASALAGLAAVFSSISANEGKKFVNSAKEWAAAVTPFNSALKSAKANTVDFSKALSSTGRTMQSLQEEISTAENGITTILSTAMEEQRALREEELLQIQQYNQRIRELEAEKLGIYHQQMEAELTMLKHRDQLTQEEATQHLANQREYLDQANEAAKIAYSNELIQIQNKHKAAGTLNSEARIAEELAAQAHYDAQVKTNEEYYAKASALVLESANDWVSTDVQKWKDLNTTGRTGRKEFDKILNQLEADNANAFLSMYLETKRSGGNITAETADIAKGMLKPFRGLPDETHDAGKEALLGLIDGMKDEIPGLKNASEMNADEIVNVLMKELEINSPSRVTKRIGGYVTEGLAAGMTSKENWLQRQVGGFVGRTLDFFKNALGIHSPSEETEWMGEMMVAGLVNALNNGRKDVQSAMNGLTASANDGMNVAVNGTNGHGHAGGRNITFNQYITSPKATSRREIYRQTHNALALAGGA